MSNWQPMATANKENTWFARDGEGQMGYTWFEDGNWVRECWISDEYGNENALKEWWNPIEYVDDISFQPEQLGSGAKFVSKKGL